MIPLPNFSGSSSSIADGFADAGDIGFGGITFQAKKTPISMYLIVSALILLVVLLIVILSRFL